MSALSLRHRSSALPSGASLTPGTHVLGLLGGGQLGRMLVHAAQRAGFVVTVLEAEKPCPAGQAADEHLAAPYDDAAALQKLLDQCPAVTTEFENVPAAVLASLQAAGCRVWPPAAAVQVCQDRAAEKRSFAQAGVPCAPHALIESDADVAAAMGKHPSAVSSTSVALGSSAASGLVQPSASLFPGILKTARMGYDGKGQQVVEKAQDLAAAWLSLGQVPCVLEQRVPLAVEFSIIVARGFDGTVVSLPAQQNLHRKGVLAVTQVPAPDVPPALVEQAQAHAQALAQALSYVGVLCVEFFVLKDGRLLANEMAPRPHNSGHYSIDACDVSQFDLQLYTLAHWPLQQPRQHSAAVMLNLMGDLWFDTQGQPRTQMPWPQVASLPGAHLHLYGKAQARMGRKMGHLTFTTPALAQALEQARKAARLLGLPEEGLGLGPV